MDLVDAAASGEHAPERLAARLREWQATAEVHADPVQADRLRWALRKADEGKVAPLLPVAQSGGLFVKIADLDGVGSEGVG
jgi:hypothetical protein